MKLRLLATLLLCSTLVGSTSQNNSITSTIEQIGAFDLISLINMNQPTYNAAAFNQVAHTLGRLAQLLQTVTLPYINNSLSSNAQSIQTLSALINDVRNSVILVNNTLTSELGYNEAQDQQMLTTINNNIAIVADDLSGNITEINGRIDGVLQDWAIDQVAQDNRIDALNASLITTNTSIQRNLSQIRTQNLALVANASRQQAQIDAWIDTQGALQTQVNNLIANDAEQQVDIDFLLGDNINQGLSIDNLINRDQAQQAQIDNILNTFATKEYVDTNILNNVTGLSGELRNYVDDNIGGNVTLLDGQLRTYVDDNIEGNVTVLNGLINDAIASAVQDNIDLENRVQAQLDALFANDTITVYGENPQFINSYQLFRESIPFSDFQYLLPGNDFEAASTINFENVSFVDTPVITLTYKSPDLFLNSQPIVLSATTVDSSSVTVKITRTDGQPLDLTADSFVEVQAFGK